MACDARRDDLQRVRLNAETLEAHARHAEREAQRVGDGFFGPPFFDGEHVPEGDISLSRAGRQRVDGGARQASRPRDWFQIPVHCWGTGS